MEDVPEPAAPPSTLRRDWFGIIVSLAALATSCASIFIAVQNADSMERLVQANSWPYLQLDSSNIVDGETVVQLSLTNTGVGPLRLEWFVLYAGDEPLRDITALVQHAHGNDWVAPQTPAQWRAQGWTDGASNSFTATPGGRVLAPGEGTIVYGIPRKGTPSEFWHTLDRARFRYRFEACYCSVFEECWLSTLSRERPRPVAECATNDDSWRG